MTIWTSGDDYQIAPHVIASERTPILRMLRRVIISSQPFAQHPSI
jgi:hypothetical protein